MINLGIFIFHWSWFIRLNHRPSSSWGANSTKFPITRKENWRLLGNANFGNSKLSSYVVDLMINSIIMQFRLLKTNKAECEWPTQLGSENKVMWVYLYKYLLSLSVRGVILKRKVLPVCMWEGPTFEVNDLMMKNVSENNFWNLVLHCFLHSNVPLKKKEILTSQLLHDGLRISFFSQFVMEKMRNTVNLGGGF
jgi:hypothetical protein